MKDWTKIGLVKSRKWNGEASPTGYAGYQLVMQVEPLPEDDDPGNLLAVARK